MYQERNIVGGEISKMSISVGGVGVIGNVGVIV
jgi:hypothetical protein